MVSFKDILIVYFNLFLSSYTTAQLAGPSCIPEGTNVVSYECSVDDPTLNGATIWQGTALNCSTRSIVLRHSEYNTTGANDTCGSLSAASVSINRTRFTSRLTFLAIHVTELDGKMLNCTLNGTALLPGSDMMLIIKVGVRPSPPEGINITGLLDSSGETRLIVSWSPPAQSVEGEVGGYVLIVSGDGGDCGCVSMNVSADTTNVTCSGINGTGQICSFEVRTISIDCGLTSDYITESIELLLPPPPTNIGVFSSYQVEGSIRCIIVKFTGVQTPNIFYIVTVGRHRSFSINSSSCNTANTCILTDIHRQPLISEDFFNITVSACNKLGCGDVEIFPTQFPANAVTHNLFQIHPENRTVLCNFLSSFTPQPNTRCLVTYGNSPHDCYRYNDYRKLSISYPGDTLTVPITENLQSGVEYCYSISLAYKQTSLSVNGVFKYLICDPSELNDAGEISTNMTGGVVNIQNGIISFSGIGVGSTAEVTCDKGSFLKGSKVRNCTYNGEWSGNIQICEIEPSVPDNRVLVSITVTAFVMIVLLCLGVFLTGIFYRKKYMSSKGSNSACALTLEKEDYNVDNQTVFELNGASNMEAVHSLGQKKDKQLVPGMSEGSIFGEVHKPFVDKKSVDLVSAHGNT
ncbi:uncharacterized protein LOC135341613 isoform X2 [Halichondria panicea]|uniref:uncharacterized protein LOC135341613 isoform X2 n=1 Tax=Halichondria panicea TaxID=6063 RepID=UPI00312BC233